MQEFINQVPNFFSILSKVSFKQLKFISYRNLIDPLIRKNHLAD